MHSQPSADVPDWSREHKRFFEWAPSKSLIASIRAYQHHAAVGANAVVLTDVPDHATAVGIPARIILKPKQG
jgi:hypothetical protein